VGSVRWVERVERKKSLGHRKFDPGQDGLRCKKIYFPSPTKNSTRDWTILLRLEDNRREYRDSRTPSDESNDSSNVSLHTVPISTLK
jgi:hypothetical protein